MEVKFLPTPAPWLCPENVLGGGLAQHISTQASLGVCQDLTRIPLTLVAPIPSPARCAAILPLEGKAPRKPDPSLYKVCVLSPQNAGLFHIQSRYALSSLEILVVCRS